MKYLLATIALVSVFACMGGVQTGPDADVLVDSFERTTGIGGTWHDRYIEDNCSRCPECCVTELWDSVEAELDIEESGCGEGDAEYCDNCPGVDCICVEDHLGVWHVNPTIGDTDEYEDFGKYDDSDWPDMWTPPDDEE